MPKLKPCSGDPVHCSILYLHFTCLRHLADAFVHSDLQSFLHSYTVGGGCRSAHQEQFWGSVSRWHAARWSQDSNQQPSDYYTTGSTSWATVAPYLQCSERDDVCYFGTHYQLTSSVLLIRGYVGYFNVSTIMKDWIRIRAKTNKQKSIRTFLV